MLVNFGVIRQRGATLRLRGAAGEAIPAGAVAVVPGTGDEWPVGYGGLVYLPDASSADELVVRWHGRTCRAALPPLPEDAVLPDLGEVRCR
jgi:outer membrane usher protein